MGAPKISPLASLDRLKALDALPDLVSQLQEAKQLCHHSARAEMILKWLMGKLKTSDEARKLDLAWELLASTVRLLPAQRIAVLSNGLVPALQLVWAAPDLPEATIFAIARLFSVLLEIGSSADGAAVKSLLSVGGDAAAKMCGDWYRHVYQHFSQDDKISLLAQGELLNPALDLWELRKHLESDDTSFNNHCLVPVLLLLVPLRNVDTPASPKRRRGHASPAERYEHALEALVSKHTILPARIVFNRKHEQQPRSKLAHPTIRDRLSPLKEAVVTGTLGNAVVNSLHLVLDVALGSVSTPTPRHRFAERPWLETVFAALSECVVGQTPLVTNRALVQLLDTIRRKGAGQTALSAQTLTGLVKRYAIPEADSKDDVDWQLVAKIVELEPDVLTNLTITEELFDAISAVETQQLSALASTWRDQIIVPAMKAFAHARSLTVFVDLWHKQLDRSRTAEEPSVWKDLSVPFADILEDSLLAEQIVAKLDQFASPVSAAVEKTSKLSSKAVVSPLISGIVLLDSLLSGTRSDVLVASLQTRLQALLQSLIDLAYLKGYKTTVAVSCHYWSLLTRIFQLWFPFWASKQDRQAIVEAKGMSILTSEAFESALAQCSTSETGQDHSRAARTGRAALAFVANVCACFQQYGDQEWCTGRCAGAMGNVLKNDPDAASILIRHPVLLQSLDLDARKGVLSSLLLSTSNVEDGKQSVLVELQALLASSCGANKPNMMADLAPVIVERLRRASSAAGIADEMILDSTLAGIDVHSMEQSHRIQILDTLSQLGEVPATSVGAAQLQARLALILKLLEMPSQSSQLLTDASRLWELASTLKPSPSSEIDSLDNEQMLQEIAQRVLSSLLTTQDREKSQRMLVGVSQCIKDTIKQGAKSGRLSANKAQLAITRIAIAMLEDSAKDDVKQRLVHRTSKTARSYLDTIEAECSASIDGAGQELATAQTESVLSALEALLDAPKSLVELSGVDVPDHAKRVFKLARGFMSTFLVRGDEVLQSKLFAVCFRLICKYGTSKKNVTAIAEDVLERDLTAKNRATVLLAYEEAFKQADSEWKLTAMTILTKDSGLQRPSALMLQQTAIKALTKEDSEAIPSTKDIVLHTLQAATSPTSLLDVRRTALKSLALIFKDRSFLTTQYTVEHTLASLQQLLSSTIALDGGALYLNICQVLTVIMAHHRSRLQGRFHLLIGVLQQLMSYLFTSEKTDIREAQSLAKLIESFCNPPALRYRKGGKPSSELVDEAKKAQAHAGQFAQYLLHSYCGQVLTGSLGEGMREALLPGLWAMIEAMEAYNEEGVKVLSAAANNSERAVLRSVYEDWKRMGKWEGV